MTLKLKNLKKIKKDLNLRNNIRGVRGKNGILYLIPIIRSYAKINDIIKIKIENYKNYENKNKNRDYIYKN